MLSMISLFVCCVGVIFSGAATASQMSDDGTIIHKVEQTIARHDFTKSFPAYVKVGNVWDPEAE